MKSPNRGSRQHQRKPLSLLTVYSFASLIHKTARSGSNQHFSFQAVGVSEEQLSDGSVNGDGCVDTEPL